MKTDEWFARKRQTGRTTRMIEAAVRSAVAGHAVYIIAANHVQAGWIRNRVPDGYGIKVESAASCRNFDWETLRLGGAHPNTEVFVDHFTLESKYMTILREWDRFDAC